TTNNNIKLQYTGLYQSFSFQLPSNTFIRYDNNLISLYISATLSQSQSLPEWISFETTSLTFSGNATHEGTFDMVVFATNGFGFAQLHFEIYNSNSNFHRYNRITTNTDSRSKWRKIQIHCN